MQKHRIYTNIGRDQKINVEIKQDFDIMEVLSLKFTQKDIYASGNCSEYGVVVGRVSANSGYGVPNARVSIFIPLDSLDEDDPVISALYPYKDISDKDESGYRYNLLPERKQHPGHTPTGTFMDQQDILTREECLEVFEKYYRYTVKTNNAGDFMIWGVPVGSQTLHIDIDLSDIGCFSLRPYDFMKRGYTINDFENTYTFKSSTDIDSLPQIISFDKVIEVYPFWGNEELCEIAITRTDFDLSERNIKIEPFAIILFSSVTDDNSDAVKRNGKIRKKSGYKCNLQTIGGTISCVRFTGNYVVGSDGVTQYPELEYYTPSEDINDDGVAMITLPMNMEYLYTNEFGEEEITNDPNKGIPTTTIARFKFGLNFQGAKIATANYLVPNIREFNPNPNGTASGQGTGTLRYGLHYSEGMLTTYQFSDNFEDYIRITPPENVTLTDIGYDDNIKAYKQNLLLGVNTNGAPEDCFYKFIFNKVYTVSSFQGTHYESTRRDAFLGIKEIRPNTEDDCASSANYLPVNFAYKNRAKFNVLLAQVVLFIQYLFAIITVKFAEIVGKVAYEVGDALWSATLMRALFRRISQRLKDFAFRTQERYTKILPLTIYPNCEECSTDDDSLSEQDVDFGDKYCRVAEVRLRMTRAPSHLGTLGFIALYIPSTASTTWIKNRTNVSNLLPGSSFLGRPTSTFPGDPAVAVEGLCSENTTVIAFSDLDNLQDETITDETFPARYGAMMYPEIATGSTSFSAFSVYFYNDPDNQYADRVRFYYEDNSMVMVFSPDMWFDLAGQDITTTYVTLPDGSTVRLLDYLEDNDVYAIARIYDRSSTIDPVSVGIPTLSIEEDCEKYDKLYDESIVRAYLLCTGDSMTYNSSIPVNTPPQYLSTCYTNPQIYDPAYCELLAPTSTHPYLISTIIGTAGTWRLPRRISWPDGWITSGIGVKYYNRRTKSGLSEFRDGVFTIIPVIQGRSYNLKAIQEWYRRKRVGLSFCGGVVNYSFIDNWLNGLLYFFKFDKRIRWDNEDDLDINQRGSKFPNELVFYNILHKEFYYRSSPFYQYTFTGQTIPGSSNKEIPGSSNKEILHPTTFYDLGPRDEFINEICSDARLDTTCTVVRDIGPSSYQDPANVVEYAINYRMDVSKSKFDLDDFFSIQRDNSKIKIFDGDITQLMSINCEAGIEAFDLDTTHYFMYNGEYLDPEDPRFETFFRISPVTYGPTPIDLKLDTNGAYLRLCLNYRLGDYSQVVPFYLWNKGGEGFGPYGNNADDQEWDRSLIAAMPLQKIFSISGVTDYDIQAFTGRTNYLMPDGEEEYILKPMTIDHSTFSTTGSTEDMLERFEVISYGIPDTSVGGASQYVEGDLWLYVPPTSGTTKDPQGGFIYVVVNKTWVLQTEPYIDGYMETFIPQTALNYSDERQVLSSPFLFYFGLIPGKTSLDLLMKNFGGVGAFTSEETVTCMVDDIVTPTVSVTPTPTPFVTPGDVSEIYFDPLGVSGNDARLAVNNPLGRLFNITLEYQITASVDNIWSRGSNPVQSTTFLYVSTNNGLTWNEIAYVTAEIPGGGYPTDQSDYQTASGTHIINGVSNVSQVLVRIEYGCVTGAQDYQSGDGYVTIIYASANSGQVNVICDNTFQVGCGTAGNLYCVAIPTPTPTVTETPTPLPLFLGFSPYDGAWSWGQSGSGYAVISTMRAENIEEFALQFAPTWITVEAWDVGHWRIMNPDEYFYTANVDSIRFYPNTTNGSHVGRGGEITFQNIYGEVMNYFDGTFSTRVYASQDGMPYGVTFEWVDNLPICCGAGCHIAYADEDPLYSDPEHGMSTGSFDFNLSFWPYFDCEAQYVSWSIYRVSPNPMVLASGTGSTTGINLRVGHIATKSGTLAQAIADGDIIRITIGTGLMEIV